MHLAAESVAEMRGGRVALGGDVVLEGLDLELRRGEFTVLLGANGSGKTTLVRALLGLIPLESGAVLLFGQPLRGFKDWARVGYVPQRFGATAGVPATVEEVVLSGRIARAGLLRPYSRADRRAAGEAIASVGLDGATRQRVSRLSGGQQQRVLMARALASDPELLLLDEPTSAADREHQQSLAATLARLKEEGCTILLVAHALGAMAPLVDRSVVLEQGHVSFDGPPRPEHADPEHVHHEPSRDDPSGRPERALRRPS
jgi:zinc transport system ATP-binding protein